MSLLGKAWWSRDGKQGSRFHPRYQLSALAGPRSEAAGPCGVVMPSLRGYEVPPPPPVRAMEASPIVTSKQREEVVHGVPTEVVCTAFSNSVLVVVTQYGKMGTIVYVDPNTIGDNVGRPSLTTKVLLGKDEVSPSFMFVPKTWWHLCRRKLGTNLFSSPWL
ncbi:proteasome assembly chaperone 3 isoform X2 [Agelaius tricolor]|uniref:proteasome assembly chaperone 3 isoform X2 n=1 Tax=Agelaius tricolor TaxID=9191 RepID=UPI0039F257E6